jgi:hypothetical protein
MYVGLILKFIILIFPSHMLTHLLFILQIVFPYIFLPQIAILCGETEKYYGLSFQVVWNFVHFTSFEPSAYHMDTLLELKVKSCPCKYFTIFTVSVIHVMKEKFKWNFFFSHIKTTTKIFCRDILYCCCDKWTHAWSRQLRRKEYLLESSNTNRK